MGHLDAAGGRMQLKRAWEAMKGRAAVVVSGESELLGAADIAAPVHTRQRAEACIAHGKSQPTQSCGQMT
jgi:hypothetical protein